MPRLTAKAAAELLQLPAYEQIRILTEQKNPRQQPQVFRAPFYAPALRGIREFYRGGNDPLALSQARTRIAGLRLHLRRVNNDRVITAFCASPLASRHLLPVPGLRLTATIGHVDISLSLDLVGHEAGVARYIYYNCRAAPIQPEIARGTIEIAHWVLTEAGSNIPIRQIEYFDFASGRLFRTSARRAGTLKRLKANARLIEAIWPSPLTQADSEHRTAPNCWPWQLHPTTMPISQYHYYHGAALSLITERGELWALPAWNNSEVALTLSTTT